MVYGPWSVNGGSLYGFGGFCMVFGCLWCFFVLLVVSGGLVFGRFLVVSGVMLQFDLLFPHLSSFRNYRC